MNKGIYSPPKLATANYNPKLFEHDLESFTKQSVHPILANPENQELVITPLLILYFLEPQRNTIFV